MFVAHTIYPTMEELFWSPADFKLFLIIPTPEDLISAIKALKEINYN